MNKSDRLGAVLDPLAETGHVDVEQIVNTLGVSAASARRDLDVLAQQQLLTRTHGGAMWGSLSHTR